MNSLTTEAEVDDAGWLNIHAPAPQGVPPGKIQALVVLAPDARRVDAAAHPKPGTLPGKVTLSPDFHAPLEDFRPYSG